MQRRRIALCSSLKQLLLITLKPKLNHISDFFMPFWQLNHIELQAQFVLSYALAGTKNI